jgi:hypothetical protein
MRTVLALMLAACSAAEPHKLQLIDAPPGGDVEPMITAELAQAMAANDSLIVYVGAPWCEPCVAFHDAAAAGKLDDKLASVRLLVFDADRDGEALEAAGYHSSLIPLFVLPQIDGRSSGRQIEGAVKDRDIAEQLVPRLNRLLGR